MAYDRVVWGGLHGQCFGVGLDGGGSGGSWKRRSRAGDITSQDDGHSNAAIFSMGIFNFHIKLGDVKRGTGSGTLGLCSF